MVVELNGTIKEIFETQVVSDKFSNKKFALTIDEDSNYPQHLLIEAKKTERQNLIEALDKFNVGDSVKIKVNLNGRVYEQEGKPNSYFNTLSLYTIQLNN